MQGDRWHKHFQSMEYRYVFDCKRLKSIIGNASVPLCGKETLVGRFARTTILFLFALCSGMASADQVQVTLTEAGSLSTKINADDKFTITSLKVSGPINVTDITYLREMAGSNYYGTTTDGQLVDLDLTDANIVSSSGAYLYCGSYNIGENEIGKYMFCNCNLESIELPTSLTNICQGAFMDCSKLTEVTLHGSTLPTCTTDAFTSVPLANATLYCPKSLIETCKTTEPWSGFGTIAIPFYITISDAGIATGCSEGDLDFSGVTGVKAYIVSAFSPSEEKVLLTRATYIPAGTGFIAKGAEGTYKIPATTTDYTYANLLAGTLEEKTVAATDGDYTNYVLGKDTEGNACFYKANNTTVSANKAYLQIPTSALSASNSEAKELLTLSFDDEGGDTTGFISVTKLAEETSGNAAIYNLNGQRKQSLTKGLNIVNGKKVLVK